MISYQLVVCFLSSLGYIRVASVAAPLTDGVLDQVFGIMCGQAASASADVRVRPLVLQALKGTLRPMQFGDIIECGGTAHQFTSTGWVPMAYSRALDYTYTPPAPVEVAAKPKRVRKPRKSKVAALALV